MSKYDLKPFNKRSIPKFEFPNGKIEYGELIDEVYVDSRDIDENTTGVIYRNLVQKIRLEEHLETFRFCYYTINLDNDNPSWRYKQHALMVTEEQLKELFNKMIKKGWLNIDIKFI